MVSYARGIVVRFSLFHIPECFLILFKIGLGGAITVPRIVAFLSTVVSFNMIKVSTGSLILLFLVDLSVLSFPALRTYELVADSVGLRISIRVIIRLII